jgi:hypothetical protein
MLYTMMKGISWLVPLAVAMLPLAPVVAGSRESPTPVLRSAQPLIATGDYLVNEGRGGYTNSAGQAQDFYYEVWSANNRYILKVWPIQNYPKGSYTTHSFRSSGEALDYFDCNYARKSLPACPR